MLLLAIVEALLKSAFSRFIHRSFSLVTAKALNKRQKPTTICCRRFVALPEKNYFIYKANLSAHLKMKSSSRMMTIIDSSQYSVHFGGAYLKYNNNTNNEVEAASFCEFWW